MYDYLIDFWLTDFWSDTDLERQVIPGKYPHITALNYMRENKHFCETIKKEKRTKKKKIYVVFHPILTFDLPELCDVFFHMHESELLCD